MNDRRSDVVSALPQLRQIALIMTGDERLADEAVTHVLRLANQRKDDAANFPCPLSWLLENLLRLPIFENQRSDGPKATTTYGMSLLDLPLDERLCLVLVDGLKFDAPLVSRIVREPVEAVEKRLLTAREMFKCLTDAAMHPELPP
ncbi:hypothetical protein [Rhizobium rhizophilum]|uniref:Uncharacterized protein n=1 Tax=Rhizobium rhizophilum TaxID=1850373 RepID=A0ABY2QS12_9HYPH|nr:hypothetical protein [Rhizobium rhizophilum]THV12425.1 hypothetical protein E9677_16755 [Rhizobium rhizophilum]